MQSTHWRLAMAPHSQDPWQLLQPIGTKSTRASFAIYLYGHKFEDIRCTKHLPRYFSHLAGNEKISKVPLRKHTHLTYSPTRSTNKIQVTNLLKRSIPTEEKQLKVHASKPSACPTSTSKKAVARAQNLQEQNNKTS